jgi:hypothetical protein
MTSSFLAYFLTFATCTFQYLPEKGYKTGKYFGAPEDLNRLFILSLLPTDSLAGCRILGVKITFFGQCFPVIFLFPCGCLGDGSHSDSLNILIFHNDLPRSVLSHCAGYLLDPYNLDTTFLIYTACLWIILLIIASLLFFLFWNLDDELFERL